MAQQPKDPSIHPDARRSDYLSGGLGRFRRLKPAIFRLRRKELFPKGAWESVRLALYFLAAATVLMALWQIYRLLFKPMLYSSIGAFPKFVLWLSLGSLVYVGLMVWYGLWQSWLRRR